MNFLHLKNATLANLQVEGFDAVSFSAFGMIIVFCGLIIISLYIFFLPKFLDFASQCKRKFTGKKKIDSGIENKDAGIIETEVLLAISAAFHLDQNFPEENQKLTWLSHGLDESAWQASGIAHGVSRRHNLHITRRKF